MNKNWVTISLVLSISVCLVIGVLVMYETKAFWGKESNENINTLNCTMNLLSAHNLIPLVILVVAGLLVALCLSTRCSF